MLKPIELTPLSYPNGSGYLASIGNAVIGEMLMDVDGFWYFWPKNGGGSWSSHCLRHVADRLDEMNKDWEAQLAKDIGGG